ncbi:MAG: protein kinase [Gemmataceae bacterium]
MSHQNNAPTTPDAAGPAPVAPLPAVPGYEVLELVGRGGMGRVYKARHLGLDRVVALKVLHAHPSEHHLARFREEARAVAGLQHPNIVQVYETGAADGQPYIAQEFVAGGSLTEALDGKPLPPAVAARLVETVARAVQFSHANGVVHRDLKPGNILLSAERGARNAESETTVVIGSADSALRVPHSALLPKVTDFGLAKRLGADSGLTKSGDILGTPSYMAPEQAGGDGAEVGPPADVYALGAVLYECLTGRPPFQGPDVLETLTQVLSMDPVPPRTLQPGVPRDLETITLKCLEKEPARRYPSAEAVADDLRRFLAGEPIVARPVGPVERVMKWARRRKAAAALVALGLLLAVVTLGSAVALGVGYSRLTAAVQDKDAALTQLNQRNAELTAAQQEAAGTLDLALAALNKHFFEHAERLKELPQGEKLRREVLADARKALDGLAKLKPADRRVREYQAEGFNRLAGAEATVGQLEAAAEDYARTRELYAKLRAEHPDDPGYRQWHAMATSKLANAYEMLGRTADAASLNAEVDKAAEQLLVTDPDAVLTLELNSLQAYRAVIRAIAGGDTAAAVAHTRRAADFQHKLVTVDPDNPRRPVAAVDSDLRLANLLVTADRADEAAQVLDRAAATIAALPDQSAVNTRKLRAGVADARGFLHSHLGKAADAVREYKLALAEYEKLAADFPDTPRYKQDIGQTWWQMANATRFGRPPGDPRAYLEKAKAVFDKLAADFPKDSQYRQWKQRVDGEVKALDKPAVNGK